MGEPLTRDLTIGIATKDRWEDLERTLRKVLEFGLGGLPTMLVDDGSATSCPFDAGHYVQNLLLRRHEAPRGYIVRRNELLRECRTPYLLSLDDDSYPVEGDIERVLDFMRERPSVLAVTLPIFNVRTGRYQSRPSTAEIGRARMFVGCGHVMRRELFLRLGGYREDLVHFDEELDLAVRGFREGFEVWFHPGLRIDHHEVDRARSRSSTDALLFRNRTNWWWRYASLPEALPRIVGMPILAARRSLGRRSLSPLRGWCRSLCEIATGKVKPERMPHRVLAAFRRIQGP